MAGTKKRPPRYLMDEVKQLPDNLFKAQLMDTSDIVGSLTLAPPTKKLMRFRQEQEADELFETPGRPHNSTEISDVFRRNVSPDTYNKPFRKAPMIKAKFDQSEPVELPLKTFPIIIRQGRNAEIQEATQSIAAEVATEMPSEGNVVVLVSEEVEGMFPSSVIEQLQNQQQTITIQQEQDYSNNVQTVFVNVAELEVHMPDASAMVQGDQPLEIDLSSATSSTDANQLAQPVVPTAITSVEVKKDDSGLPSNVMEEESSLTSGKQQAEESQTKTTGTEVKVKVEKEDNAPSQVVKEQTVSTE